MAGVKGKSGGSRANTGGARPGAGRKPNPPVLLELEGTHDDPRKFLLDVMNDRNSDARLRVDAAKSLMAYTHRRVAEVGKKADQQVAARKASTGRFAATAPPLHIVRKAPECARKD